MSKSYTFRDIFYISRRCSDAFATLKKAFNILNISSLTTYSRHRDNFRCVYIRTDLDSGKSKTIKTNINFVALSRFDIFMRKRRNIIYIYLSKHTYNGMSLLKKTRHFCLFLCRECVAIVAIFNLNHEFYAFDTKK